MGSGRVCLKKETAKRSRLWIRLGCARSQGNRRLRNRGDWSGVERERSSEIGAHLKWRRFSHLKIGLRRMTGMRDYKSTLRDIHGLLSSRQSRNPVQHQIAVSAIALDKIRPLSHLHSPRHLIGLRSLRLGQEGLLRLECAKRPSDARLKTENRQIHGNQGWSGTL